MSDVADPPTGPIAQPSPWSDYGPECESEG